VSLLLPFFHEDQPFKSTISPKPWKHRRKQTS
jgi:hypothetical protein